MAAKRTLVSTGTLLLFGAVLLTGCGGRERDNAARIDALMRGAISPSSYLPTATPPSRMHSRSRLRSSTCRKRTQVAPQVAPQVLTRVRGRYRRKRSEPPTA
jgi:hypothetical protein